MNYNFEVCKGCGLCCKIDGFVFLKDGEAEKIAEFLGMDVYSFTEKYCTIVNRKKLALKDKLSSNECIFLDENNLCKIYEVRPEQCRNFPYLWTNSELPQGCLLKDKNNI